MKGIRIIIVLILFHNVSLDAQTNRAFLDSLMQPQLKWIGKPLPDFTLKRPDDSIINSKDFQGKPIIINFWFANCPPCVMEIPILNKLKQNYASSDIAFIAMTFENRETTQKFLEKNKFDFIQICSSGEYINQFTSFFPVTLFVDRKGIIRAIKTAELAVDPDFSKGTKANVVIPDDYLSIVDEIIK